MEDESSQLPQPGSRVERVSFDYQCRLLFGVAWELVINAPFRLQASTGVHTVDPEDLTTVTPLLGLLHATLESASLSDGGTLSLVFVDGIQLSVVPDDHYEAWELVHRDGRLTIALPGGGLAVFPARPSRGEPSRRETLRPLGPGRSTTR